MKTDDLIERLAAGLEPVRSLRPPTWRAAWWILGAAIYIATLVLTTSRSGLDPGPDFAELLAIQAVGVIAAALASVAAFESVVPGHSNRMTVWALVAAIGWLVIMMSYALGTDLDQPILAAQHEWACVGVILVGGAPLVATLAIMLRKGAPLHPVRTALLAALAVGLLTNFAACIFRAHSADTVTLAWHGGALLALILICITGARFILKWKVR